MRKLFTILFLAACSQVFAQKVIIDTVEKGIRSTGTKEVIVSSSTDKLALSVSLISFIPEERKDTIVTLGTKITSGMPLEIQKGGRMLLKLFDDNVIELKASNACDGSVRDIIKIGNSVFHTYSITPIFDVTSSQLNSIIEMGVKKVRVEISPDFYDKEFKKDKIGKTLIEHRKNLLEAISKSKSFDRDF